MKVIIAILMMILLPVQAVGYQNSIRGYQKTVDGWDIYSDDNFCMMSTLFEPQTKEAEAEMRASGIMMAFKLYKAQVAAQFSIGGNGWHFIEGKQYEVTFRFDGVERDFFINTTAASKDRLMVEFDFRELSKEWYEKFKEAKVAQIQIEKTYIGAYQFDARTASLIVEDCVNTPL